MEITDCRIDSGQAFDWGRISNEYAMYRDIYPDKFYNMITDRGLCVDGQRVLDIGTGTGVLPRNMYRYRGIWTGTDISSEQIEWAKRLAKNENMNIDFRVASAEELDFPDAAFDVVTACQCFFYFMHDKVVPKLAHFLKAKGRLLILYMVWLPGEDEIAGKSEELVLKYNPNWSGAGYTRHSVLIPEIVYDYFEIEDHEECDLNVPFTKESWHGRMKACRGVGASLSAEDLKKWDAEHMELLDRIAEDQFNVLHFASIAVLKKKTV